MRLFDYLTSPNPAIDRSHLRPGSNTVPVGSYEVEGVRPWVDFNLRTVWESYPDILQEDFPSEQLHQPPPIAARHLKPVDESCVESILKKHNHTIIDCALELTSPMLQARGLKELSMSWGSLGTVQEYIRPDWAGIVASGNPPYENRIPGETKQSRKWHSRMESATRPGIRDEFFKPLRQMVLYCCRTNTRYGYIVTDAEALFFRRTKSEDPPESLSANRPRRVTSPITHNRVTSINSVISGTSAMSLDSSGSPYTDEGNPDFNEAPLEIAVVPWEHDSDELTINLAIWFIHMLGASEISVEILYPTLGCWHQFKDASGPYYRQEGSRRTTRTLPKGGRLVSSWAEIADQCGGAQKGLIYSMSISFNLDLSRHD